jgi:hypothetical protein
VCLGPNSSEFFWVFQGGFITWRDKGYCQTYAYFSAHDYIPPVYVSIVSKAWTIANCYAIIWTGSECMLKRTWSTYWYQGIFVVQEICKNHSVKLVRNHSIILAP